MRAGLRQPDADCRGFLTEKYKQKGTNRNQMSVIQVKKEDHIAILSVVRPEALNALSREIVDEMGEAIDAIEKDQDIYCLIFHSEKNFAAGADIKKIMQRHPKVEVLEMSDLYPNKGTDKYYRSYVEVKKSNVKE